MIESSFVKNYAFKYIGKFWKRYRNLGRLTILSAFTWPIIDRGNILQDSIFVLSFSIDSVKLQIYQEGEPARNKSCLVRMNDTCYIFSEPVC